MMKFGEWGDSIMLKTLSLFFGLRVTVLTATALTEQRFRHDLPMAKADLVLVYNGHNHYSATSTLLEISARY